MVFLAMVPKLNELICVYYKLIPYSVVSRLIHYSNFCLFAYSETYYIALYQKEKEDSCFIVLDWEPIKI